MQKYNNTVETTSTGSPQNRPKRNVLIRKLTELKVRMESRKAERASLKDELSLQSPLAEGISNKKVARVDKAGIISYYVVVGSIIDIASGLGAMGIAVARSVSISANSTILGKWYGMWREKVYKLLGTTEQSSKTRKYFTELIAYLPFRTPVYTVSNIVGNIIQEGKIDLKKALIGTLLFVAYSPAAAPLLGAYVDRLRRFFGIKSAAEGAYGKAEGQPLPLQIAPKRKPIGSWIEEKYTSFIGALKNAGSALKPYLEPAAVLAPVIVFFALFFYKEISSGDIKKTVASPIEQVIQKEPADGGANNKEKDVDVYSMLAQCGPS